MAKEKLTAPIQTSGRLSFRFRSLLALLGSSVSVTSSRLIRGPRLPGWSWAIEIGTHFLRRQTTTAFDMQDISTGRETRRLADFHFPSVGAGDNRASQHSRREREQSSQPEMAGNPRRLVHTDRINPGGVHALPAWGRLCLLLQISCKPDRAGDVGRRLQDVCTRLPPDPGAPLPCAA